MYIQGRVSIDLMESHRFLSKHEFYLLKNIHFMPLVFQYIFQFNNMQYLCRMKSYTFHCIVANLSMETEHVTYGIHVHEHCNLALLHLNTSV